MRRPTAFCLTGIVFYSLVGVWGVGILSGELFGLPYVQRMYGGVTLPIWLGVIVAAQALGNLCSGAIWRGRATILHDRDHQPRAYWLINGMLGIVAVALLGLGLRNWLTLPG